MRFFLRQMAAGAARLRRTAIEPLENRDLMSLAPALLKNINPTGDSGAANFVQIGALTLFSANDGTNGNELWRSDGTPGGTMLVKDISPGLSSSYVSGVRTAMGGALYFAANDGASGSELWRSDGTAAGTWRVKDINPTGSSSPVALTTVGSTLFFTANDGANGPELWKSDGTEAGTVLVEDLRPGSVGSAPGSLLNVGGTLYFTANDGTSGVEIWKSNGTPGDITLVKDIRPGTSASSQVAWLTNVGGAMFFTANQSGSIELWRSDGSPAGTNPVREVSQGGPVSPASLTAFGGQVYFAASGPGTGIELWRSNGTPTGTVVVKDILPGDGSSSPMGLVAAGGKLFFFANDGTNGNELWKSDGTPTGTTLVKDINPGAASSVLFFTPGMPAPLADLGGSLFFPANNGTAGTELWRSDGTSGGTSLVANIAPGAASSNPARLMSTSTSLYFQANDGANGVEPWVIRPPANSTGQLGRRIFYNQSKFDGGSAAIDAADDAAIATDKVAFKFAGGTATAPVTAFTNYSRGINGLMIDFPQAEGITLADFTFKVGANGAVANWLNAPTPNGFSIRPGAGTGGSDRIAITWANNAIQNTWLQVIVEGYDTLGGFNINTGLAASDVFFFGNRIGDTFISPPAGSVTTTAADALSARGAVGANRPITNPYDFDRSRSVTATDELIARSNSGSLTRNLTWNPLAGPLAESFDPQSADFENAPLNAEAVDSYDALAAAVASALATSRAERVAGVANPLAHQHVGIELRSASEPARPPHVAMVTEVFKNRSTGERFAQAASREIVAIQLNELIDALCRDMTVRSA